MTESTKSFFYPPDKPHSLQSQYQLNNTEEKYRRTSYIN